MTDIDVTAELLSVWATIDAIVARLDARDHYEAVT